VSAEEGIEVRTDRAIPAVLLVNELITNAAKYAYPAGNCRVWVTLSRAPKDNVLISVRDALWVRSQRNFRAICRSCVRIPGQNSF
jgi:two-component sensor histidine kinase